MPWKHIMDMLEIAKMLVYLGSIIQDYFRDRVVLAQTASSMIRKGMACDVPQGSLLGPLLWITAFDNILKEDVPLSASWSYLCDYSKEWYSHAWAKGKHHSWSYDPLDRVRQTEPSRPGDTIPLSIHILLYDGGIIVYILPLGQNSTIVSVVSVWN